MARMKKLTWIEIAGAALVGGLGYAGYRHARGLGGKVKAGDAVGVPLSALVFADPSQTIAANVSSIVDVTSIEASPVFALHPGLAHGLLRPLPGVSVPVAGIAVSFPLAAVTSISRNGVPVL